MFPGASQSRARISYFSLSRVLLPILEASALAQLEARVDPPDGERVAARTARILKAGPPVVEVVREDVRRVRPEVPAEVFAHRAGRQLGQVVAQLVPRLAPREVGVALAESRLGQGRILFGVVNASDRKMTPGSTACASRDQPRQNATGLVCGLSTRKMRMPRLTQVSTTSPACHSASRSAAEGREVERIDVLVALRRILGELDAAVRRLPEPLGMLLHPRMVGRCLESEVQRHLEAERLCRCAGNDRTPPSRRAPSPPRCDHPRHGRSPTASRGLRVAPSPRCSDPSDSCGRLGGSVAGRRCRTPSRQSGAGATRHPAGWLPGGDLGRVPASAGRARTTPSCGPARGPPSAAARAGTASPRCGPGSDERRPAPFGDERGNAGSVGPARLARARASSITRASAPPARLRAASSSTLPSASSVRSAGRLPASCRSPRARSRWHLARPRSCTYASRCGAAGRRAPAVVVDELHCGLAPPPVSSRRRRRAASSRPCPSAKISAVTRRSSPTTRLTA